MEYLHDLGSPSFSGNRITQFTEDNLNFNSPQRSATFVSSNTPEDLDLRVGMISPSKDFLEKVQDSWMFKPINAFETTQKVKAYFLNPVKVYIYIYIYIYINNY